MMAGRGPVWIIYDSPAMETRLIAIRDLSPADEREWSALADRAIEPNPFFEPGYLSLASRHFQGFSTSRLLIAQEGTAFRGVLPIIGVERTRIPPRPVMTTRGVPTMVSGMCTPLVDRDCVDTSVGALLDGLRLGAKRGDLPGILSLKRIGENGPVVDTFRREAAARGMPTFTKESWERGSVTRSGKWESPLGSERRRTNRRRRRALANDSGSEVTLVDRTLDPSATDDFITMEAAGWKGQGDGTAVGRDPVRVAWFHDWREWWVKAGRVTVYALNVGDKSIAMQYCVRAGEGIFLVRIAYDETYAKYGPGALLLESLMEALFTQSDAAWIDSCTDPNNAFMLQMLPEPRPVAMVLIGTGGAVDRGLISAMPAITRGVDELSRIRQRLRPTGRGAAASG
jgi:hypothetical protein